MHASGSQFPPLALEDATELLDVVAPVELALLLLAPPLLVEAVPPPDVALLVLVVAPAPPELSVALAPPALPPVSAVSSLAHDQTAVTGTTIRARARRRGCFIHTP